jgi:hypothetical protein
MLDIKECRKIERECTKHSGKNLIFGLDKYPFVYLIITHGDGKSWGYFTNNEEYLYLGRSDRKISGILLQHGANNSREVTDIKIISDNPEVVRVYKELSRYICNDLCWYYYPDNRIRTAMMMNPVLLTNLVDAGLFNDRYEAGLHHYSRLSDVANHLTDFEYQKPLIKDAFGLSPDWVKVYLEYSIANIERIKYLKSHNFTTQRVRRFGWYVFDAPEKIINNDYYLALYCSTYSYRDYIGMREDLPEVIQKHFPLFPKDVEGYHNRILQVTRNHAKEIEERKLQELQNKYMKEVYNKACQYNYSDSEYSIIACEKLIDLKTEGDTLNHCVGTYVNSVSQGREYILFLRKNYDIDTPYFTVDLTPDGRVRQIHGKCNCNMKPEMKPFVEKWAKKFGLDLTGCSGVKCALG